MVEDQVKYGESENEFSLGQKIKQHDNSMPHLSPCKTNILEISLRGVFKMPYCQTLFFFFFEFKLKNTIFFSHFYIPSTQQCLTHEKQSVHRGNGSSFYSFLNISPVPVASTCDLVALSSFADIQTQQSRWPGVCLDYMNHLRTVYAINIILWSIKIYLQLHII